MNEYKFDDIFIGQEESFKVNVTQDTLDLFKSLSGDVNPLHIDKSFAENKGYKDKVCYGMAVASFYSTLVGVYLPGENCLLKRVEVEFSKPVYIGDSLIVEGSVFEKHESTKGIVIKAVIKNQDDKKVSRARIEVGLI